MKYAKPAVMETIDNGRKIQSLLFQTNSGAMPVPPLVSPSGTWTILLNPTSGSII